jgi:NAD(P)-dependent dehydrogenase (short-subunit alcohol dehydrogenase family)
MKTDTIIVSGSAGLIGSETVKRFAKDGQRVVGLDNDMRSQFFGAEASTRSVRDSLVESISGYEHHDLDIRDAAKVRELFQENRGRIAAVVHTAAQPSHDWAARDPQMDFGVNANGTLNLLEAARRFCPEAPFIYTSTNKVYGDTPNLLPLFEAAIALCQEPALALHFGERVRMQDVSIVGLICEAAETTAEVGRQLNRYGRLMLDEDGGAELIRADSLRLATMEPVNVTAPMATPIDISTRLGLWIAPGKPMSKAAGA